MGGGLSIAEMGEPRHRVDVELRSLGGPTDALLQALSARLLVPLPDGTRARPVLRMDGASLRGDPTNPAKEKLRLRFFFPSRHDVDKNPFELLGGLDLGAGEFSLTEKWDVYRDTLVHALAYVAARDAN